MKIYVNISLISIFSFLLVFYHDFIILYGAPVVSLALLMRLINCLFIIYYY